MISYFKKKIKKATNSSISNNNEAFNYFNQQVYFPRGSILYKRTIDEGIYEKENVNLITSLLKPGTTIFDIGANIGLMAIPVLSFDDSVQVISVEASPNTLPYLMKTQKSSQFSTRWKIIDKAVSDRVGLVNFHLADASNGAFESLQDTERVNFTHVKEIESTTIDLIWEENEKPEVSFIKIDIEGADLLALKGGVDCINNCKPSILMEWNQTNIKPFKFNNIDLLKFVDHLNYEIFYLPEVSRISSLAEMNLLNKRKFAENYLLVPKEDF